MLVPIIISYMGDIFCKHGDFPSQWTLVRNHLLPRLLWSLFKLSPQGVSGDEINCRRGVDIRSGRPDEHQTRPRREDKGMAPLPALGQHLQRSILRKLYSEKFKIKNRCCIEAMAIIGAATATLKMIGRYSGGSHSTFLEFLVTHCLSGLRP